jgi:hypothetical protein
MPGLGATDPADLEAQARAELGFSRRLEQPPRISPYPGVGGSGGYAVWYCEQQLQRFDAREAIYVSRRSIYRWEDRDSSGKPWILPLVRHAKRQLLDDPLSYKEYAPICGDPVNVELAMKFVYGSDADLSVTAEAQTLSGTGACHVGRHFLSKFVPKPVGCAKVHMYIPNPTWGNHRSIFNECGMDVHCYRYYDAKTNRLDYAGLIEDLANAPDWSVILLHACAHNPMGAIPRWNNGRQYLTS